MYAHKQNMKSLQSAMIICFLVQFLYPEHSYVHSDLKCADFDITENRPMIVDNDEIG